MDKREKNKAAKPIVLKQAIDYSKNSVVSKTLVNKKAGTLTLFAFDKGQGLSEHVAPFDALVQILDGAAEAVIAGRKTVVPEGCLLIMPAGMPHALTARKRFKMLLTMIRAK